MRRLLILSSLLLLLITVCVLAHAESPAEAKRTLPLISIRTVDPDEGNAFVSEPVNGYVARSIASWTPGYVMPPEPYYADCIVTYTGTDGVSSVLNAPAQVKVRGNWTTSYEKKPLRIKFQEKQSLGGLNHATPFKNWVLLAEYKDFSLLRDKAAFDLAEKILSDGLYCSDCELVEVEINGEYWGVYLLAEQQQCADGRVNVPEPKKDQTDPDVGYFLEFDGYWFLEDSLHAFTIDYAGHAPIIPFDGENKKTFTPLSNYWSHRDDVGYTIKSDIYSVEQHDTIAHFVSNTYRIMYSAAYQNKALEMTADYMNLVPSSKPPREAVEAVVDVQSLAEMYILSEITCDPDIYWSSFFMSVDLSESGSKKLRFEAPWDFDSAMGNRVVCVDGTGFHAANVIDDVNHEFKVINPWLAVLMQEDWFREIIAEKWTALYDSGAFEETIRMIRRDSQTYKEAFERNARRWDHLWENPDMIYELNAESIACRTEAQAAEQLAGWLEKRIRFLNDTWHQ